MKLHFTCVAVNSTGVEQQSLCLAPTHSLHQSPVCGGTCVKKQYTKVTFGSVVFGLCSGEKEYIRDHGYSYRHRICLSIKWIAMSTEATSKPNSNIIMIIFFQSIRWDDPTPTSCTLHTRDEDQYLPSLHLQVQQPSLCRDTSEVSANANQSRNANNLHVFQQQILVSAFKNDFRTEIKTY